MSMSITSGRKLPDQAVGQTSILRLANYHDGAIGHLEPFTDACPKEGVVINDEYSDSAVWFSGVIHALPSSAGRFPCPPRRARVPVDPAYAVALQAAGLR